MARRRRVRVVDTRPEQPAQPKPTEIPQTLEELQRQEDIVQRGTVEAIRALRIIREHDLYRFFPHKRNISTYQHMTFDEYIQERWKRTRQWATQEIQWLEVCEQVEKRTGKSIYHYPHKSARELRKLMPYPDQFAAALCELGEKVDSEEVVQRRLAYVALRDEWNFRREGMPELQYKEFIALQMIDGPVRMPATLDKGKELAAQSGRPLKECLIESCREWKALPPWRDLLTTFRCMELEEVCLELLAIKTEWQYAVDAKEAAKVMRDTWRIKIAKFRPDDAPVLERAPMLARIQGDASNISVSELTAMAESLVIIIDSQWEPMREDYAELAQNGQDVSNHPFIHLVRLNNFVNGLNEKPEELAAAG